MLDAPLKPEKHLTAEEVGRLVGRDERLVQQMYRAHLIDAAELRRGKVVFSPTEAHRWKKWYLPLNNWESFECPARRDAWRGTHRFYIMNTAKNQFNNKNTSVLTTRIPFRFTNPRPLA